MIKAAKWDIVTIQQGSPESWNKAKTQPAADELIAYIRKNAPQAAGDLTRTACMTV